jgi:bifunctional DNA-binding transcriptional regulator/antitoxin component of YhaV-PrlF toxin-antitoxin module
MPRTGEDMAKVPSKYQVTVPKAIADRYRIVPGDEIDWVAVGDVIGVIPGGSRRPMIDPESRVRSFDQATERHMKRAAGTKPKLAQDRGWTREELYGHGRAR